MGQPGLTGAPSRTGDHAAIDPGRCPVGAGGSAAGRAAARVGNVVGCTQRGG
jgi:hypothetical protein